MQRFTRRKVLEGFLFAGLGTASAAVLGACSGATPAPPEAAPTSAEAESAAAPAAAEIQATLQIWTYPRTENDAEIVYKPMMEKFVQEYPGIKPQIDVQPWGGRREKLYAAAAAGEPPDIWFATTDTLPAYIEKGVILPLSDLITAEELADYSEAEIAAASYEGKLYMPLTEAEVNGFGYNAALLAELGYDPETTVIETWDDIYTLAEKAKAKNWYVEHLGTMDWAEWLCTIHEAGGTVFSADGTKATIAEQPGVDALTRWVTEYKNGWVPLEYAVGTVEASENLPDYWLSQEQVTARREDAACWLDVSSVPELQYLVGHPRRMTKEQNLIAGLVSGQGWAITKASKNQEAALIWVKWMIKPENIGWYCTLAGATPVGTQSKEYWKPGDPCVLDHVARFSPYLFADFDTVTLWQESKVICGPHFQAAVLGEETVEEALAACEAELNAVLQEKMG